MGTNAYMRPHKPKKGINCGRGELKSWLSREYDGQVIFLKGGIPELIGVASAFGGEQKEIIEEAIEIIEKYGAVEFYISE